jgi:hypothetical protein
MIKVHCVDEEYWYISKERCQCGGEFEMMKQSLMHDSEGTPMDVLNTICKKCGSPKDFVFDISSFFGRFPGFEESTEVESLLKKVYPESEVKMKMASPMEATLMFIRQLKESDDILALEYIAGAILWAMGKKLDDRTN